MTDNDPTSDGVTPYDPDSQSTESADPVDQSGSTNTAPHNSVADVPFGSQNDNIKVLGRQIPSSTIRGNQTIVGSLLINNPSTNTTTLQFSGSDENIILTDPTTGLNRVIIGAFPSGGVGIIVSNPGIDVLTLF